MDDFPLVRALLVRLLGLSAEDAMLPLAVLANLHRPRVQAPFLILPELGLYRLGGWSERRVPKHAARMIDRRYRSLSGGRVYTRTPRLHTLGMTGGAELNVAIASNVNWTAASAHWWLLTDRADMRREKQTWRSWDPALQLYALTGTPTARELALSQLELQLGAAAAVSDMLLWLADLTPLTAHAL